jgi:hypothetical protein
MTTRQTLLIIALWIVAIAVDPIYASDSTNADKFRIRATRIDGELNLSGKLDDPRWRLAEEIWLDYEIQPGENIPPPQKTSMRALYNSDYIYFGFMCLDSNLSQIRAHVSDRDKIFEDDFVGILLDTYGDNQRAYEFFVNPFGIQGDIMRSQNEEDASFDAIWSSAAAVNDTGWTAEMAIPFKSLRFPSKSEQKWILIPARVYSRASRHQLAWMPLDRNNPCVMCQGGALLGINDIQAITTVEVLPYVMGLEAGSLNDSEDPSSGFQNGPIIGRVGAGVKYSPDPGTVIDAVVNPDFSQVESDAAQISVNTTFALFYPEKRPFFLEGTELFKTRIDAYYSRMINNPLAAAKVTEKSGALSMAYIAALDRDSPLIVPEEERSSYVSTSLRSFSNILRARYDLGKESFIGGLITTRNFSDAHNYVGGFDWNAFFAGSYYFRGQLLYSNTKEINDASLYSSDRFFADTKHTATLDGEIYDGTAVIVALARQARDYSFGVSYQDFSPTFQAQNGFVNSNNRRSLALENQYTFYPTNSFVDRAYVSSEMSVRFNHSGTRRERWVFIGGGLEMKGQTNLYFGFLPVNEEIFADVCFEKMYRVMVEGNSKPISSLSLYFDMEFGRFIHRTDLPELGTGHEISLEASVKPTEKLQVNLSYSRARLSSVETDELLFDGNITRAVAVYQFSPELYIRAIAQYDSFDKSVELYPLLSYKLNPFTIFYVGSTQSLSDFGDPVGMRQTARQFFVKLQYLWRS